MNTKDPGEVIETRRIRLRPLTIEDSEDMFELYSDTETMKYWSSQPVSELADARQMVQGDIDWALKGDAMVWAITSLSSGKTLGKCILFQFSKKNHRAEVGYVLNRSHWGQGLMTEVLTGMIDYAFENLGLHRLEADTDSENHASIRLLEKLGFCREGLFRQRWRVYGEWQDSVMLGLLKPEWEARQSPSVD